MKNSLFEKFKKHEVNAASLEEFCNKYHKREAYHERGAEYMRADLQSHAEDLRLYGYTIISQHDSTTGEVVAYYGNQE